MSDLTDERRAAIVRREAEATRGPWTADTEQRGDCVVWGPDGKFVANMGTAPHWVPDESGERRHVAFDVDRRDAEFIAQARLDIPLLLGALAESEKNARDAGFELARQAPTVAMARGWRQRAETAEAELARHNALADARWTRDAWRYLNSSREVPRYCSDCGNTLASHAYTWCPGATPEGK